MVPGPVGPLRGRGPLPGTRTTQEHKEELVFPAAGDWGRCDPPPEICRLAGTMAPVQPGALWPTGPARVTRYRHIPP